MHISKANLNDKKCKLGNFMDKKRERNRGLI